MLCNVNRLKIVFTILFIIFSFFYKNRINPCVPKTLPQSEAALLDELLSQIDANLDHSSSASSLGVTSRSRTGIHTDTVNLHKSSSDSTTSIAAKSIHSVINTTIAKPTEHKSASNISITYFTLVYHVEICVVNSFMLFDYIVQLFF